MLGRLPLPYGIDTSGRDHIDPDVVGSEFCGEAASHANQGHLGGGNVGDLGKANEGSVVPHKDDRAETVLQH